MKKFWSLRRRGIVMRIIRSSARTSFSRIGLFALLLFLRVFNCKHFAIAGIIAILAIYAHQTIASIPTYMPLDSGYTNYHTGSAEVYNSTEGLNYGKAKVNWNYWYNSSNDYWYYAYSLCNNESGVANDRTDDYHFGTVYNGGSANPINAFTISLPVQVPVITGNELLVVSTFAGSSTGISAWDPLINESSIGGNVVMTGVEWFGSDQSIAPTQWNWTEVGPIWKWIEDYAGDTSRNDFNGQYFEIASKFAPGLVVASVSNSTVSSDTTASGSIYGPVPEPATVALLGFGFLAMSMSSYRRKTIR
jgi:hypothetical protein